MMNKNKVSVKGLSSKLSIFQVMSVEEQRNTDRYSTAMEELNYFLNSLISKLPHNVTISVDDHIDDNWSGDDILVFRKCIKFIYNDKCIAIIRSVCTKYTEYDFYIHLRRINVSIANVRPIRKEDSNKEFIDLFFTLYNNDRDLMYEDLDRTAKHISGGISHIVKLIDHNN